MFYLLIEIPGLQHLAEHIFSNIGDLKSLINCKLVSRSWRDFINARFKKAQMINKIQQIVTVSYSKFEHPIYPIYTFNQHTEGLHPFLKEIENSMEMSEIHILIQFLKEYWHAIIFVDTENKFTKENLIKLAKTFQNNEALKVLQTK